jgi:cyclophilin family peptidyl-prolyl cis-trans isomerase
MRNTLLKSAIILFCLMAGTMIYSCKKDTQTTPASTPAKAGFTLNLNGADVMANNTSTGATSYSWDFGDGNSSNETSPTHNYHNGGTYRIKLKASNSTSSDTTSQAVTIAKVEKLIQIKTRLGEMVMWLYDETPKHKDNFIKLADSGYFDSTTFHRVVKNFVSQGGDPNSKDEDSTNDGFGGPPYTIPFESNTHGHVYGAVGAASTGAYGPSSGSQFYIVNNPSGTSFLDGKYVVFGYIIKGIPVAVAMADQPQNSSNRPYKAIRMDVNTLYKTRAQILSQYGYIVK